jgi:hypothetical protein
MSKLITNTIRHTGGSADNITLTSGGHVLIGDGGNDNAFFKAHAADGEASDLYVAQFINAEATAGVNYGVNIQGGSNSTDHGLRVKNHAGTSQLLVRGDGNVGIGTSSPSDVLHIKHDNAFIMVDRTSNEAGISLRVGDSNSTRSNIATQTNGDLAIDTANTERLRVLAGGGLTFNGDTAAANALDDYEEGTFTPAYAFSTSTGTFGYLAQTGKYTKIGNRVIFTIVIRSNSHSGTSDGLLMVSGLPYAVNSSDTPCPGSCFFITGGNMDAPNGIALQLNSTEHIEFYGQTQSTGSNYSSIEDSHVNLSGLFIKIQGQYPTP